MKYDEFLEKKEVKFEKTGIRESDINVHLFPFQRDIVRWALRMGKAAIFADCGLGKTICQLSWADVVAEKTGGNVLILAPLAVAPQTVREGERFGIDISYARSRDDMSRITITNYEMLNKFDPGEFSGVVLDESSILKSYTGKFRNEIIDGFKDTPFKLACTATPAPNDHMELGNHSEFLGAMSRTEMLAMFFVHDGGETQKWRLKKHAIDPFWKWVCSWAAMIRAPSDMGYDDEGFILPSINFIEKMATAPSQDPGKDYLFAMDAVTLSERQTARRSSTESRVTMAADIVNSKPDEPWIVWCDLNKESLSVKKLIKDAVEVKGSDSISHKEKSMIGFSEGTVRVLVTKPSIAGFGMNWQHCSNVVFLGLSDSYEKFYQAIRRCWRFGQDKEVDCYIVTSNLEGAVVKNIKRKEKDAETMATKMSEFTRSAVMENINPTHKRKSKYMQMTESGEKWEMNLGDCVDVASSLKDNSIDYTVFSPPFSSLYTYSDSDRDMGNCKNDDEFYEHFKFLVPELLRATSPGRLLSFHCMNLPMSKTRDGVIGIRDFRGELIRMFTDHGWIYHSEVVIWKDPVVAMQRTKALGLLYKQLRKDSAMSRQGLPDYLVTLRKPGDNPKPITHTHDDFPVGYWQRYASPVWMDINPSNTLQHRSVREEKDERHICPLQLEVIERAIDLWSSEGDTVFSPFAGIGSEGYCAIKKGRRFVGAELKSSYFKQACSNLREASDDTCSQLQMFGT